MSIKSGSRMLVGTAQHEEYLLSIRDFLQIIRRWIWVIILTTILSVGAAVGFSLLQTPVYEASTKVILGGLSESPSEDFSHTTVAELAESRTVAEAVISSLNLSTTPREFMANMRVQQAAGSQVMEIFYQSSDPQQSQEVANATGKIFSQQISELSAGSISANVWELAAPPESPTSPNPRHNGLLGLAVGLLLGVGLAFLLEYFDDSWRSPQEAEMVSGAPTLGVIRKFEPLKDKRKDKSDSIS